MPIPDDMPEPLRSLLAGFESSHKKARELQKIADKKSDEIENLTLMGLWAKLGNETETYWEAMKAVGSFVEVHNFAEKTIRAACSPQVGVAILEALAAVFQAQADMTRATETKLAELAGLKPKPPGA